MRATSDSKLSPAKLLCVLAREFRGTRDVDQRVSIAHRYAEAVNRLIETRKWRHIPPLEDQLPDEWMPAAFFQHWELRVPRHRTANTAVVGEGKEDVAILTAILPAVVLEACELQSANGRTKLARHAHSHADKHHAPVAILFDTDTLDQPMIATLIQEMNELVRTAVVGVPFDLVWFIPHVEVIFFEGTVDLCRIFPRFKTIFSKTFADSDPKGQLHALFEKGAGPRNLGEFLGELTSDEVEKIQATEPIQRLMSFIVNHRAPVALEHKDAGPRSA